jgi:hypothetical protein
MKNFVLFALGIFVFSCGKKQETSLPIVGPITESVYASGVLKTAINTKLMSPSMGLLANYS